MTDHNEQVRTAIERRDIEQMKILREQAHAGGFYETEELLTAYIGDSVCTIAHDHDSAMSEPCEYDGCNGCKDCSGASTPCKCTCHDIAIG